MELKPTLDRLVLETPKEESRTAGGIIIPDNSKDTPQHAKVIAVGPGMRKKDGTYSGMDFKVGETVVFKKFSGTKVSVDGLEYLIVSEGDVLGVLN
jgi:chaperonin GroES